MSVYQDQYVIVNIWTNSRNKALPGVNKVGHISITTPSTHISLWPESPKPNRDSFFKGFFSPFISRPTAYYPDYEQDCIVEGAACKCIAIGAGATLEEGEKPYRYDSATGFWEHVDSVPRASKDQYFKIKPLEANFRMALYSVDSQKVVDAFNELKHSTKGWSLIGSNVLSRSIGEKANESCSSLVYRCLAAGGLYNGLKSTLSSQTCCAVDPEDLLRHVVAAKEKELIEYPKTVDWFVEGVKENAIDKVKKAYSEKGLNANVEDDLIPGLGSFGLSYLLK